MDTKELTKIITDFRDARDWKQFHNPKDLALSVSLEAAELLENFQWSADDLYADDKKDKIKEELADVLMYCFLMADVEGFDIEKIILDKLDKNNKKYPVELAKGSKAKYTELKNNARHIIPKADIDMLQLDKYEDDMTR